MTCGEFDDQQALAARDEFAGFPEKDHYHELYDFLGVTEYRVSSAMIERLARESAVLESKDLPDKKVAIVARRDDSWGLMRMYASYQGSINEDFQFFENLEDALRWLDVRD